MHVDGIGLVGRPAGELHDRSRFRRFVALEGYKLPGAAEHERITAEAIGIYNRPKLGKAKAKGTLEAFSQSYKDNPLNKLDDRFYNLKEETSAMRTKFIREYPEQFISQ